MEVDCLVGRNPTSRMSCIRLHSHDPSAISNIPEIPVHSHASQCISLVLVSLGEENEEEWLGVSNHRCHDILVAISIRDVLLM